jgi:hypothetical protein
MILCRMEMSHSHDTVIHLFKRGLEDGCPRDMAFAVRVEGVKRSACPALGNVAYYSRV